MTIYDEDAQPNVINPLIRFFSIIFLPFKLTGSLKPKRFVGVR